MFKVQYSFWQGFLGYQIAWVKFVQLGGERSPLNVKQTIDVANVRNRNKRPFRHNSISHVCNVVMVFPLVGWFSWERHIQFGIRAKWWRLHLLHRQRLHRKSEWILDSKGEGGSGKCHQKWSDDGRFQGLPHRRESKEWSCSESPEK